jgi:hypothetical protein
MNSKQQSIPRGIRNNNPLNLRVGNNWKGEVAGISGLTFEQFTEMKWGVRGGDALVHVLWSRRYAAILQLFLQ